MPVYVNLGDAYWKAHNGGRAITSYVRLPTCQSNNAGQPTIVYFKLYGTQRNWDYGNSERDPKSRLNLHRLFKGRHYYNLFICKKDFTKKEKKKRRKKKRKKKKKRKQTDTPNVHCNTDQGDFGMSLPEHRLYLYQKNYDEAISVAKEHCI